MPHWKSMVDREFMYAFDLQGKDVTVTIERVVGGELTGPGGKKSKKPLAYFKESKSGKPLALNATNCKAIAGMYGNDTDGWLGKRVTLFPTTTQMGGDTVECIRVRPGVPKESKRNGDSAEREPGADG